MRHFQWNPWHGCHKCSPGCLNCFVYYLDSLRNRDTSIVVKSKTNFSLPIKKDRKGNFKIPSGAEVATCFTSDFFIEEADSWRAECWDIIKERQDVNFLICTKRPERMIECLPNDWKDGYENVILAVTCENQKKADERLPILLNIKAKHRYILVAPILENVDLSKFLSTGKIELVSVGGESYQNARICDFEWIRHIKETCDQNHVLFDFHQTGSHLKIGNKIYQIKHRDEYRQARRGMQCLKNLENRKKDIY